MARHIVLLGLLAVITRDAWGSSPQTEQSPAERAQRCITFVHTDVRWVWPDGRDGAITVTMDTAPPKAFPFPPEAAPKPGPFPLARAGLDRAVRRVTNLARSHEAIEASARGYEAFERQQYLQSEKEYSEAIRVEPTEPQHYCSRGIVRMVLGQNEASIADFTRAIEVSGGNAAEYHRKRAKTWYWLGQPERALAEVTNAISLDPNLTRTFIDRALYRAARGDYDGAVADIDQALRIAPTDPEVRGMRFQFLILKRDVKGALGATDDLVQSRSAAEQGTGRLMRMALLQATGDLDQALQIADACVSRDPEAAQLRELRAKILLDKRQFERARTDCDHALRLDPMRSIPSVYRALAWKGQREYRRALADLDAALQISPDNHAALAVLAWLLATCPDATIRDGRTALDSARRCMLAGKCEDPHCLESLAAAEAETGDFASAVRTEQEALAQARGFGPMFIRDAQKRLGLYQAGRPFRDDERETP